MSIEPDVSAHLHSILKVPLQNNDKQGEIDAYYKLLSSGYSVGQILSATREVAPPSGNLERFRLGKSPNLWKWIDFLFTCTVLAFSLIASLSIITHSGRDAEPPAAPAQSDIPSQTEAVAMASGTAAGLQPAVEPLTPSKPASRPQKSATGAQETIFATQKDAEASHQSNADQPDASERATDPAVENRDAAHAVPAGNASAALPPRGHPAKGRIANASRQYVQPRLRVRQQAHRRYQQSVYYGQHPGSYYTNSNRGYGYGGPRPNSDTGG
jgi:hypothetical protein